MPKIVTPETRKAEVRSYSAALADAVKRNDWKAVAEASGQIQRRSRQLAGLGRGG